MQGCKVGSWGLFGFEKMQLFLLTSRSSRAEEKVRCFEMNALLWWALRSPQAFSAYNSKYKSNSKYKYNSKHKYNFKKYKYECHYMAKNHSHAKQSNHPSTSVEKTHFMSLEMDPIKKLGKVNPWIKWNPQLRILYMAGFRLGPDTTRRVSWNSSKAVNCENQNKRFFYD